MRRLITAAALLLSLSALAHAEPAKGKADDLVTDSAVQQAALKRAFDSFRQKLTVLAGRLEASDDIKDRERAKSLRAALKEANERGTDGKFDALIRGLAKKGAGKDLDALAAAVRENAGLREDLKKMLALLNEDVRGDALKKRADSLKDMLATLKELRDRQARLQARTDRGKEDNKELARQQEKLKGQTEKALDGKEVSKKAKDAVGRATGKQGKASGKLNMGKPGEASEDQGGAIDDLDEAINDLENELNENGREREEQKLRDLLARVKKMLVMQTAIRDGIDKLYLDVRETKDEQPTTAHSARANKIADAQTDVLKEVASALKLLREDGIGIAFIEVFEQVEKDMIAVRARMDVSDAGKVTQRIADDVVETLKEMVAALEKKIAENTQPPMPPMPPGTPGPRRPKPLVEFLQQLKMVQAMQRRVNGRTELYAKRYSGEQAPKPDSATDARERRRLEQVRKELGELSLRQESIKKVTKGLFDLTRE